MSEIVNLDKKHESTVMSTKKSFKYKDTERLKVKGWKRMYHANTNQKKTRESIPDKAGFREKILPAIKRDILLLYVSQFIKRKDIKILNVYARNNKSFKVPEAKTNKTESITDNPQLQFEISRPLLQLTEQGEKNSIRTRKM